MILYYNLVRETITRIQTCLQTLSVGRYLYNITHYQYYTILHQSISILHKITNITVNLLHLDDIILVVMGNIGNIEKYCLKTRTILLNITNITQYYFN